MKSYFAALLMLQVSAPALATDSLDCSGDVYALSMSVGSDNTVDSATLTDRRTKMTTTFLRAEIENKQLIWLDSEGDYSANRLAIVLRKIDEVSFIFEATGRKGALRHGKKTYKLVCDWTR
jgi:bifunctional ADP-heptose synthase (sugar kinase/adenylyltransferase)